MFLIFFVSAAKKIAQGNLGDNKRILGPKGPYKRYMQ